MKLRSWFAAGLVCMGSGLAIVQAADASGKPGEVTERIGIYDSRVIAYANFWSASHQHKLNELARNAREAKAAGQTARFQELQASLKNEQERGHLQVFSTAPIDDILAGMKERVDVIRKEAGVSRLVSKWDESTLRAHKGAGWVDVTDALLREFKLDEKQQRVVEDMRKKQPLPLEKAQQLMQEGKL